MPSLQAAVVSNSRDFTADYGCVLATFILLPISICSTCCCCCKHPNT